jgi:hypothetical protein
VGAIDMGELESIILPITAAVFAVGMLAVLTPRMMDRKRRALLRLTCPVCQHEIVAEEGQLTPLPLEMVSFIVREDPSTHGLPLGELRCRNCGVHHVYATHVRPPRYLMPNPLSDKVRTSTCAQCRAPLARPSWPRGMYDGRIAAAPGFGAHHGLECTRCGAVVCVRCTQDASSGRTKDGSYVCPRCFRGPLETVHHF